MTDPKAAAREPLRPSEAVLRHIEGLRATMRGETRLPTVREMARDLGVGASTVSVVYRSLANRGLIRTEVGNGSFLLPPKTETRKSARTGLQIGIGLGRHDLDDPHGWLSRIYGGLTLGALRIGHPATLVPFYLDESVEPAQVSALDAIIMLPGHLIHPPLIDEARKSAIPVVYFNPPEIGATRNFVSPDYATASRDLGRAFRAAGRRNIVMLLSDPWQTMVSAHYRTSGLLSGLEFGSSDELKFRIVVAGNYKVEDGRKVVRRWIKTEEDLPDAIYASGDFLAMGCVEELEAHGISVPEQVSVVGGSGLNLEKYSHPQLTCSAQPYEGVGAELVGMILRLLKSPEREEPGVFVPMQWIGGATTAEVENAVLFR